MAKIHGPLIPLSSTWTSVTLHVQGLHDRQQQIVANRGAGKQTHKLNRFWHFIIEAQDTLHELACLPSIPCNRTRYLAQASCVPPEWPGAFCRPPVSPHFGLKEEQSSAQLSNLLSQNDDDPTAPYQCESCSSQCRPSDVFHVFPGLRGFVARI